MSKLIDGRMVEIDAILIHHSQEQDGNVLMIVYTENLLSRKNEMKNTFLHSGFYMLH